MPNDVIYEMMDAYINGQGTESNKRKSATIFSKASEQSLEDLKLRSLVRDAKTFGFLAGNPDGFIYHVETGVKMGRQNTDVFAYLKMLLVLSIPQHCYDRNKATDQGHPHDY